MDADRPPSPARGSPKAFVTEEVHNPVHDVELGTPLHLHREGEGTNEPPLVPLIPQHKEVLKEKTLKNVILGRKRANSLSFKEQADDLSSDEATYKSYFLKYILPLYCGSETSIYENSTNVNESDNTAQHMILHSINENWEEDEDDEEEENAEGATTPAAIMKSISSTERLFNTSGKKKPQNLSENALGTPVNGSSNSSLSSYSSLVQASATPNKPGETLNPLILNEFETNNSVAQTQSEAKAATIEANNTPSVIKIVSSSSDLSPFQQPLPRPDIKPSAGKSSLISTSNVKSIVDKIDSKSPTRDANVPAPKSNPPSAISKALDAKLNSNIPTSNKVTSISALAENIKAAQERNRLLKEQSRPKQDRNNAFDEVKDLESSKPVVDRPLSPAHNTKRPANSSGDDINQDQW